MKILLVEEEQNCADLIQKTLTEQNYLVDVATDGQTGLRLADLFDYDLILLDLIRGEPNGIQFCQQRRTAGDRTLILLITGENSPSEKVKALDAGADECLTKPIEIPELLAHIRALMRRKKEQIPMIEWQGLRLDIKKRQVSYYGKPVFLNGIEYALLELFLHNRNRIFSQNTLLEYLWSYEEMPSEHQIRKYINSLETKLLTVGFAGQIIEKVYGLCYRFSGIFNNNKSGNYRRSQSIKNGDLTISLSQDENEETVYKTKITTIFQNYRHQYFQKIEILEEAVQALKENSLSYSLKEQAIQSAHTLAGSLGLFGFKIAADKSRQLEKILKSSDVLDRIIISYLQKVVLWLREELEKEVQPPVDTKSPLSISSSHTPYILIVDDDRALTEIFVSEAHSWGMEAKAAHTLSHAREAIAEKRPDLVILDLCFPESQEYGLELLAELTTTTSPIPVLVFTVEEGLNERLKVAQLGARGFLKKPVTPEQMMEAITQLLRQGDSPVGKLMIVDDDEATRDFLLHLLDPWGFKLIFLENSLKFWEVLEQENPDLLILEVEMSDFTGIDLCQIVRNDPQWSGLAILMLSEHREPEIIEQVFAVGADDYVEKPIIGLELIARIFNRLERNQMRRRLAEVDSLTGLSNRRKSVQDLSRLLNLATRQNKTLCFVLLDLDYFKHVNDRYGHDTGDQVLRQLGKLLKQNFRGEDVIARWGGEEFVLGLYGIDKKQGIERIDTFLQQWRQQQFSLPNLCSFQVSFSAGVAVYPEDGSDLQTLYKIADSALYKAKSLGRNQVIG